MKTIINDLLSSVGTSDFHARVSVIESTNTTHELAYEQVQIQMLCEIHAMLRALLMKSGTDTAAMSDAEATMTHK